MNEMIAKALERRGLTIQVDKGGECKGCFLKKETECFNYGGFVCFKVIGMDEIIVGDHTSDIVGLKEEIGKIMIIVEVHE